MLYKSAEKKKGKRKEKKIPFVSHMNTLKGLQSDAVCVCVCVHEGCHVLQRFSKDFCVSGCVFGRWCDFGNATGGAKTRSTKTHDVSRSRLEK